MTTTSDAPPMEVNDAQQRRRQFAQAQEAKFDQIRKEFRPVEGNPLITPLTRFMDVPDADLDVLYRIRKDGDFEMPPMPLLKTHIDEDNKPLNIRRYQKQMICHLAAMPRFIDGDSVGLGKTLCSIAALCAYHEQLRREGKAMKVIVFTTTSTAHQWANEIERFSGLKPWVLKDAYKFRGDSKTTYGHKARLAQLQKFLDHPKLDVLICRYSQWIGRRKKLTTALDADQRPVDSEGRERLSQESGTCGTP